MSQANIAEPKGQEQNGGESTTPGSKPFVTDESSGSADKNVHTTESSSGQNPGNTGQEQK
jgi:hypothetical protein